LLIGASDDERVRADVQKEAVLVGRWRVLGYRSLERQPVEAEQVAFSILEEGFFVRGLVCKFYGLRES
jgi:hypothetical protein